MALLLSGCLRRRSEIVELTPEGLTLSQIRIDDPIAMDQSARASLSIEHLQQEKLPPPEIIENSPEIEIRPYLPEERKVRKRAGEIGNEYLETDISRRQVETVKELSGPKLHELPPLPAREIPAPSGGLVSESAARSSRDEPKLDEIIKEIEKTPTPVPGASAEQSTSFLSVFEQGTTAKDREITAEIRKLLVKEEDLSFRAKNVAVITEGGWVTLQGFVPNEKEARLVESIAAQVVSARNVINKLLVGKPKEFEVEIEEGE